jgi:DNA-binding response OmpR family regulator
MHVQRLRAKLGDAGDLIETVRGFGYRIRDAGAP